MAQQRKKQSRMMSVGASRAYSDLPSAEELADLLQETVAEYSCLIESIQVADSGAQKTLLIVVDYVSGTEPVSLDTVADLTQAISARLDQLEGSSQPYTLEVSSPGAGRRLSQRRHWERSLGRLLEITLTDQSLPFLARLLAVKEEGVEIARKKNTKKGQAESYKPAEIVAWDAISRSKVEIEFNQYS